MCDWDESLGKELHQFLNYWANVIARSKMTEGRNHEKNPLGTQVSESNRKGIKNGGDKMPEDMEKN